MSLFGAKEQRDKEFIEMEQEAEQDLLEKDLRSKSTVISKDITFTGSINGDGVILVEGNVNGNIDIVGEIKVFDSGAVNGPIIADDVIVAGDITGNIIAYNKLIIAQTGKVTGTIITNSLTIDDGGRFNGKSIMNKPIDRDHKPSFTNDTSDKDTEQQVEYSSGSSTSSVDEQQSETEEEASVGTSSETADNMEADMIGETVDGTDDTDGTMSGKDIPSEPTDSSIKAKDKSTQSTKPKDVEKVKR